MHLSWFISKFNFLGKHRWSFSYIPILTQTNKTTVRRVLFQKKKKFAQFRMLFSYRKPITPHNPNQYVNVFHFHYEICFSFFVYVSNFSIIVSNCAFKVTYILPFKFEEWERTVVTCKVSWTIMFNMTSSSRSNLNFFYCSRLHKNNGFK